MSSSFNGETPRWNRSLVVLCEKCGKKIDGSGENVRELKDQWKKALRNEGLGGATRVVVSSCLDVCPEGKLTVARLGDEKEVFTFEPKEADDFFEYLKKRERDA